MGTKKGGDEAAANTPVLTKGGVRLDPGPRVTSVTLSHAPQHHTSVPHPQKEHVQSCVRDTCLTLPASINKKAGLSYLFLLG